MFDLDGGSSDFEPATVSLALPNADGDLKRLADIPD